MLVMEKSRDIAILKTMGASRVSMVRRIFMLQGLIIGLASGPWPVPPAATPLSLSWIGTAFCGSQMEVYQVTYVPFTIEAARLRRR